MIDYKVLNKIMSDSSKSVGYGKLFDAMRIRNDALTDEQLLDMIRDATLRLTPQVGESIQSTLEIQMNHGNMHHYVFTFGTKEGDLISAQRFNARGRWEPATIIQHRKAG